MAEIDEPDKMLSSASLLSSRFDWEKLLTKIGKGLVIPVLGPELLCVPENGEPATRLYDIWGKRLAERCGIEVPAGSNDTPLLYQVANRYSSTSDQQPGDLEYYIDSVIYKNQWPLPAPLLQLAEITDFPLYLTTTIDHLLEQALLKCRLNQAPPEVIAFKQRSGADLPNDFHPGSVPSIFHLFGRTCADPGGFASTEDALIEFSWALIDQQSSPKNLYDYLQNKTLLLLGCNFPDWLDRFFIHALTRRQGASSSIGLVYVSRYRMEGLYDFLRRKHASTEPQCPVAFVAELHRRWRENQGFRPMVEKVKRGTVFISYPREERETALKIRKQLEEANIDTWMDESGLEPGDEFKPVIRDNIENASFFLALISKHLNLEGSDRLGRFVLREWKWAEEASMERHSAGGFLQPVILDDTPPRAAFVDRPFRDMNWTVLDDGLLPLYFIEFLRQGIRRFRNQGNSGN